MIEEEGTVMEVKGNAVLIKAERTTSCESCMSKDFCHSLTETDMVLEADNEAGANVGDRVIFTVGAATLLKAGVLIYLIPLIGFIFGVVLGQAFAPPAFGGRGGAADLISAALGFFFLFVTLLWLRRYAKRAEKNRAFRPRVVKVV
jgi:sigma-E factor negative regulatory protein RseC